jgi:PAS domain S-box-containing protein
MACVANALRRWPGVPVNHGIRRWRDKQGAATMLCGARMRRRSSVHRLLLYQRLLLSGLAVLLVGGLWLADTYAGGLARVAEERADFLAVCEDHIQDEVERARRMIDQARERAGARLEAQLREQVERACAVIDSMRAQLSDQYPQPMVEQAIIEALRGIRFNQGRGYYFVTGYDGVARLWPTRPDREGVSVLEARDSEGRFLVRDQIALAREQGAGFYHYTMSKPGAAGDQHPKLSYIRGVPAFDWYVGSGEYLDDHIAAVQEDLLDQLAQQTPRHVGYVFAGTFDGISLLGPARGTNVLHGGNPQAREVVARLIATARVGGDFVRYVMPAIDGQRPSAKLSYVTGIPEWGWYIGAGIALDPIEDRVAELDAHHRAQLAWRLLLVVAVLVGVLAAVWYFSRWTINRVAADLQAIRQFLAMVASGAARIDAEALRFEEFADLARSGEGMLAALQRSEGRFQSLVEQIPLAVLVCDAEGRVEYLNPHFRSCFGHAVEELGDLGQCWEKLLPTATEHRLLLDGWRACALAAGEGPIPGLGLQLRCDNGGTREVEIVTARAGGRLILVFHDLSERVAIQRELEEARAQLLAAIEHSPAGIAIAQAPDCRFLVENAAARAIRGAGSAQPSGGEETPTAPGMTFLTVDGRPLPFEESPLLRAMRRLEVVHNEEVIFERADGQRRLLLSNAAPIFDDQGNCRAAIVLFHDITEQRATEEQLRQVQKLESIGQLAGGVAHDFNNQLAGIQGFAELLQASQLNERQRKHVDRLLTACRRAADLTRQLLAFARKGGYHRATVAVHEVIAEVVAMLERTIDKRISIVCELTGGDPVVICDPGQLQNALLNLGLNARDAMPEGGVLSINTRAEEISDPVTVGLSLHAGLHLLLRVSDTGCGIDPAIRERIFEPFFTTKPAGVGTGMGLAAVYGTVSAAGGDIVVESTPGQGSSFTLLLPVSVMKRAVEAPPAVVPARHGGASLLLVDDEELLRDMGATMLEAAGYRVTPCASGEEAIEHLRGAGCGGFDLILLDMVMPGLGGRDTYHALRALDARVPVVIVSGYSLEGEAEELRQAGIAGFLAKPFRMTQLTAEIERCLAVADSGREAGAGGA